MAGANTQDFFKGLRAEVFAFLKDNNLAHIDQNGMLIKAAICYSLWLVSYLSYLTLGHFFGWYALLVVPLLAFSMLCIVLGVMHDGSHGTFGDSPLVNRLAAYSLGFAGGSSMLWYKLHVRAHHDSTNVMGHDQDFESGGLLRLHPSQEVKSAFRYQHFYAWFLYMGHALRWVLFDDIRDYFTNPWALNKEERRQLLIELIIVKTWHVTCFGVIPFLAMGWQVALVCYLLHWMMLSLSQILVFAMAHLSNVQDMPAKKGEHPDWALHQLATTVDFSSKNRLLSWVVGGLNFQIEHHIFPKISHSRYPLIQGIVKDYCKRHGVEFFEYPTFFSVVRAHFQHLKSHRGIA